MRHVAAVFGVWLALTAPACGKSARQASPPPEQAAETLSIMTYNVNFGLAGAPDIIDVIRDGDADVVVLQETSAAWERTLRPALAARYPHTRFRHAGGAGGLAILSRAPIRDDDDYIPAPSGWFPAWRLVVDTQIGPVQVLAVHLRPPVSDSGNWVTGQFTTPRVRLREIKAYVPYLAENLPTVIAGDFNEDTKGRAISYLAERGFRSALEPFDPDTPTWRWDTKLGTLRARLDHILHDTALCARSARVLPGGRSDHLAVLAVLALQPAGAPPCPTPDSDP